MDNQEIYGNNTLLELEIQNIISKFEMENNVKVVDIDFTEEWRFRVGFPPEIVIEIEL